jgi:glycosyltransferase involved in cell wall biosynthesis
MTSEPLVTVIIPTYNRADKVCDAIKSVLDQTYKNIQIIVVDDGSRDETCDLIKSRFPQVELIHQTHAGQAAARNNGLRNAKAEIIANLDSDDIWEPEFLSFCVHKLVEEKIDFVFANWTQEFKDSASRDFLSGDPFLKPYFYRLKDGWIDLDSAELRNLYLRACPSPSSSVVMRKASIVSGWDEKINIGDDWTLYLDMILSKTCRASFTLKKLWRKRVDDINIYDGRVRSEVLSLLYISDLNRILERHNDKLTIKEQRILERTQMEGLVELSKHKIIREFKIHQAMTLFRRSYIISKSYTFWAVPKIIYLGLENKIKGFFSTKVA